MSAKKGKTDRAYIALKAVLSGLENAMYTRDPCLYTDAELTAISSGFKAAAPFMSAADVEDFMGQVLPQIDWENQQGVAEVPDTYKSLITMIAMGKWKHRAK